MTSDGQVRRWREPAPHLPVVRNTGRTLATRRLATELCGRNPDVVRRVAARPDPDEPCEVACDVATGAILLDVKVLEKRLAKARPRARKTETKS